uniref:Uncharacterized protein n=1 Tax=Arundo donax TaxID=35708 RepID=A0A0A9EV90_ARUDO
MMFDACAYNSIAGKKRRKKERACCK